MDVAAALDAPLMTVWNAALDVIFPDVKERLCYFRSILPMTKNGSVMAGENFGLFSQVSDELVYIYFVNKVWYM